MQDSYCKKMQNSVRILLNSPQGYKCTCCNAAPSAKSSMIKSTRAAVNAAAVKSISRQIADDEFEYTEFPIPSPQACDPEIPYEYRWPEANFAVANALFDAFKLVQS